MNVPIIIWNLAEWAARYEIWIASIGALILWLAFLFGKIRKPRIFTNTEKEADAELASSDAALSLSEKQCAEYKYYNAKDTLALEEKKGEES